MVGFFSRFIFCDLLCVLRGAGIEVSPPVRLPQDCEKTVCSYGTNNDSGEDLQEGRNKRKDRAKMSTYSWGEQQQLEEDI